MGPPGQYLTSLYSSGSDRPVTLEPGISIQPHLSHEQENAHADNSCNYDRVVRERGRRVGDTQDVEGGTRTQCHQIILERARLSIRGDRGKHGAGSSAGGDCERHES